MDRQVGRMSSGIPVCPICQQEHHDTVKSFDTGTVCNKCNPMPGLIIPPQIIKKMYARFNVDSLAFYYRKDILAKYMQEYMQQMHDSQSNLQR